MNISRRLAKQDSVRNRHAALRASPHQSCPAPANLQAQSGGAYCCSLGRRYQPITPPCVPADATCSCEPFEAIDRRRAQRLTGDCSLRRRQMESSKKAHSPHFTDSLARISSVPFHETLVAFGRRAVMLPRDRHSIPLMDSPATCPEFLFKPEWQPGVRAACFDLHSLDAIGAASRPMEDILLIAST